MEREFFAFEIDVNKPLPSRRLWIELVKLRARYQCEDCGAKGRGPEHGFGAGRVKLDAHHVDGKGILGGFYDRLSNGRALCNSCHRKEHIRMEAAVRNVA